MDTSELQQCVAELFADDDLTSVVLVTSISAGSTLVLTEEPEPFTPSAPADLFLVKLIVGPGNPGPAGAPSTSPGIGIEVWLPPKDVWNGRVHNIGGLGGFDGGNHTAPDKIGWFYAPLVAGMEGAVTASTDSGHSASNGSWAMNPDGSPAHQLWVDFSHRAMHEMAVKSKAIAEAFYGRPPSYSYYEGASTGGRHGYSLAQRYPDDYDGIIANLPTIDFSRWILAALYREVVIERELEGAGLTEEQMDLVSNAAIAASDVVGGEHLGYIFDNPSARYDPTKDPTVLCPADGGTSTSPHCVSMAQAAAINKIWYGPTPDGSAPDPAVDNGTGVELGDRLWYGLARGTSLYVAYFAKLDPRLRDILQTAKASGNSPGSDYAALVLGDPSVAGPGFENAMGNGQIGWKQFTYEDVTDLFERAAAMEETFAGVGSNDPDLTAFNARGGKFLSFHGWNDESIPVQTTMRYYDRVVEVMGGLEQVQSFFKLYVLPGVGHMSPQGTSNEAANPPTFGYGQLYGALVNWVEHGIEPGPLEITSPNPALPGFTQPLFPYPTTVTYTGGDVRSPESYAPSPFN